jgi:hypothetical protein
LLYPDLGKYIPRLKRELQKSMIVFGKRASGSGRYGLANHLKRAGGYDRNSPIWKKAKGGKRVFYHTGAFRNAPSFKVLTPVGDVLCAVMVGFIENSAHPGTPGRKATPGTMHKIAGSLIKGFSFTPTPKMRKAFWAQVNLTKKIRDMANKPAGQWTSPPRDFTKHLNSAPVKNLFKTYLSKTEARVLKDRKTI